MNEAFESWWSSQDWAGMYEPNKHSALIIWQASRGSLVVDLPTEYNYAMETNHYHAERYNRAIQECRDAIHAAGVKTK